MSEKKQLPVEQGEGAPLWMVSFTDAMTNILTFFILLLTFSSFGDKASHHGGPNPENAGASLFNYRASPEDGMLPTEVGFARLSEAGSEKPDPSAAPVGPQRPRRPIGPLDTEAYRDRRTFYVRSTSVFYGFGPYVTEIGDRQLAPIAEFLRRVPCQVIIGESSGPEYGGSTLFYRADRSVERAYAVMEYFVKKHNLPADRFAVSATTSVPQDRFSEAVVEITLLARSVSP